MSWIINDAEFPSQHTQPNEPTDNSLTNILYRLWSLNFSTVTAMMNDPDWYKVVFIRDPLERALSAVLDKGYVLKTKWETFMNYLTSTGSEKGHHLVDQHLRPQHKFCDLYKYHDRYRVLSFSDQEDRKVFFDENGLWTEYGASNWSVSDHNGKGGGDGGMHDIRSFGVVEKRHSRNAADKLLGKYTMRTAAFVLRYYQYDYLLFNLSVPSWICQLVARESKDIRQFLPVQHVKMSVRGFKSSTKLDALRGAVVKYEDLMELYFALNIFPEYLRPPCMPIITRCVEQGECDNIDSSVV